MAYCHSLLLLPLLYRHTHLWNEWRVVRPHRHKLGEGQWFFYDVQTGIAAYHSLRLAAQYEHDDSYLLPFRSLFFHYNK